MGGKRVRVRSRRSASNIQVVSLLQLFVELLLLYYIFANEIYVIKIIFDNEDKYFFILLFLKINIYFYLFFCIIFYTFNNII